MEALYQSPKRQTVEQWLLEDEERETRELVRKEENILEMDSGDPRKEGQV